MENTLLRENERLDYVNDKLSLIQNTEGLTFGTDALLLAGYISDGYTDGIELGSGTGIISMLLLTREKLANVTALEVQAEYAVLTRRNAELNSLSDRLTAVCADVREYRHGGEVSLVYTNPPYMKTTSGKANLDDKKNIARHEVYGSALDFVKCAARSLKWGGDFAAVYRTDRMMDLLSSMRDCGIEPKRLTVIMADEMSPPSLFLVVGRRGGRCGLKVTRPLIIYSDSSHKDYTPDMNYIMNTGSFPQDYYIK